MGKSLWLLILLALIPLVAAACSGASAPAAPSAPTAAPAAGTPATPPYPVVKQTPGTGAPAAPTATAPALTPAANPYPVAPDGKALVAQRCVECHNLSRIESAKKSQADWLATVNRMKGKGAKLDDAETQAVVAHLAATFK